MAFSKAHTFASPSFSGLFCAITETLTQNLRAPAAAAAAPSLENQGSSDLRLCEQFDFRLGSQFLF